MKKQIEKFIKSANVRSIDDLTDEQVVSFFVEGLGGKKSQWSAFAARNAIDNKGLSLHDVVKSMRKAMETKVNFECYYIENESANGEEYPPQKYGWMLNPS